MGEVIIRGPVFTNAASLLIDAATREIEEKVTLETHRRVRVLGQAFFRYHSSAPTGEWFRHVRHAARKDYHVVTDSGIVYGHWLEGTGSRNRTTRFKGYFMWRKTYQSMLRSGAMNIAQPIIDRVVRALNG